MRGGGVRTLAIEHKADRLRQVLREIQLLQLEAAELAGALDEAGYGRAAGSETTVDWIRHECRVAHGVGTWSAWGARWSGSRPP